MSSLQRKSNQEIMLNELNYRIARNSAFISICMSAVLAPLTHGSSLVSWMISVPQFAFNLYKTFRCKLERKRRHLERPSGSLAAAFVAPVAGTIGMFAGLGMDAIFDSLNSLTATDAANFAAPYNNGPPPPDQQVEQGVQVVESVIMAFGEEQISGMVEKALLANTVDTRYANLSAKSVGVVLSGLCLAKLLELGTVSQWRCDGCLKEIIGERFQCLQCSFRCGRSYDLCTTCVINSQCKRSSHSFNVLLAGKNSSPNARRTAICDTCGQESREYRMCSMSCKPAGWDMCDNCHQQGASHRHPLLRVDPWALTNDAYCDACCRPFNNSGRFSCMTCGLFDAFDLCANCFHSQAHGTCDWHVFKPVNMPTGYSCCRCSKVIVSGALYSFLPSTRSTICGTWIGLVPLSYVVSYRDSGGIDREPCLPNSPRAGQVVNTVLDLSISDSPSPGHNCDEY